MKRGSVTWRGKGIQQEQRLWNVLAVTDTLICCLVIFPLCVLHWRGCWDLQDAYIYPKDEVKSSWVALIAGSIISIAAYVIQHGLYDWFRACTSRPWCHHLSTRLYMYVFGWGALCYWRGLWNLMDHYCGVGLLSNIIWLSLSEVMMLLCKSTRTLVGAPFAIALDFHDDLMEPDVIHAPCGALGKPQQDELEEDLDNSLSEQLISRAVPWPQYLVAVCYSQFCIISLNVSVWRSLWNILDDCLFPHHHLISDLYSLIAGYIMTFFIFLCQVPTSVISVKLGQLHPTIKLIYEDLVFFVATWAVLLLWRGGWNLTETYFLPDKVVGGWTSHWIGTLGLLILQGFVNVGGNGLDRDGRYRGGEGIYPTDYLREIFKYKFQRMLPVYVGRSQKSKLDVPITPGTTCAAVIEHFKGALNQNYCLMEVVSGTERLVEEHEYLQQILAGRELNQEKVSFYLVPEPYVSEASAPGSKSKKYRAKRKENCYQEADRVPLMWEPAGEDLATDWTSTQPSGLTGSMKQADQAATDSAESVYGETCSASVITDRDTDHMGSSHDQSHVASHDCSHMGPSHDQSHVASHDQSSMASTQVYIAEI